MNCHAMKHTLTVASEGLEFVLDHQAGTVESLELRELSKSASTKAVHQAAEGKITKTKGASPK